MDPGGACLLRQARDRTLHISRRGFYRHVLDVPPVRIGGRFFYKRKDLDKWIDASPSTTSFPFCFVISGNVDMIPVAFGRNHTLYYGLSGYDDSDGGVNSLTSPAWRRSTARIRATSSRGE